MVNKGADMKKITLELDDNLHEVIEHHCKTKGISIEEFAIISIQFFSTVELYLDRDYRRKILSLYVKAGNEKTEEVKKKKH